jgi:hypothetical protein
MIFRADSQVYDTADMLSLDVDGIYLTVYVDVPRGMVFYQTFDEEQGVLIHRAPPGAAEALLKRIKSRNPRDVSSCRDWLKDLITTKEPHSRRGTDKPPEWKR